MQSFHVYNKKWPWLASTLNFIEQCINERTPWPGDGIMLTEYPGGFIISLKRLTEDQTKDAYLEPGTNTEGWQQMTVIDPTDCTKKYIWYWGTAPVADQTLPPPASQPISTNSSGFRLLINIPNT